MYVYLDESGDLGFGQGGTKYFTIAFVIMKNSLYFKRCVKRVKVKYAIPRNVELKGFTTREDIKADLLIKFAKLDVEIHSITARKRNIDSKLRRDTNIFYNYMIGLSLVKRILQEPPNSGISINIDKRITSLTSGAKLDEYLRYKIWYEGERQDIELNITHIDSRKSHAIQGIDVICNSIFRKYNSNNYKLFNIIRSKMKSDSRLFFGK